MTGATFEQQLEAASGGGLIRGGEAKLLYTLARNLPQGAIAAEIGSWMGKSSTAIALGLREVGGRLHTIDDHRGIEGHPELPSGEGARQQFYANLEAAGVRSLIEHHPISSDDLAPSWKEPLDFIFIDGCHEYDAARRDTFQYAPFVKPGGWIAFHDVGMKEAVFRAINEWIDEKEPKIATFRFSGLILAVRLAKEGETPMGAWALSLMRFGIPNSCGSLPERSRSIARLVAKLRQGVARRIVRFLKED